MTEAKPIAAALPGILDRATQGTGSSALSTIVSSKLTMADLEALPTRLDDTALALVEMAASSPLPALAASDDQHFAKCMRTLSILPSRADDDVTGKLRLALYQRKLGAYPADALSFMVSELLDTQDWFPSIHQCLTAIRRWARNDEAVKVKARAAILAGRERQIRLDETMARLSRGELEQDEIDAMPGRWKRIAEEAGYLREVAEGIFASRIERPSADVIPLAQPRSSTNG